MSDRPGNHGLAVRGVSEILGTFARITARGIAQRQGAGRVRHLDIKDLWIQEFIRLRKAKIVKIDTKLTWADIGTKPLTKQRLEELPRLVPVTRGEGFTSGTAVAAMVFLASLVSTEATTVATTTCTTTKSRLLVTTFEPNTTTSWLPLLLLLYAIVVTVIAVMATRRCRQVQRLLALHYATSTQGIPVPSAPPAPAAEPAAVTTTEGTTANAEGSHGGVVGDDEARARQAAAILEKRFGVRDIEQLLKARRIAYSGVRKAVMIQRFLNQTSRATDRQIVYMNQLLRANHTLTLNTEDVDSKGAATSWITTAQSDTHERNRAQRDRLDQYQTLIRR